MKSRIFYLFLALFLSSHHELLAQSNEVWAMTSSGGGYSGAIVFKTDINGENHSVPYSFHTAYGRYPHFPNLCEASNAKLNGLLKDGSVKGLGVLYEYNPSTKMTQKKECRIS